MSIQESSESGAVDVPNDLTARNERAVRRLFEEVYSRGELRTVEDLVAPDYIGYCSGTSDTYRGPAGLKSHATRLRAAFFGFRFDIDEIRGTPDGVEVLWTATGRQERAIMGIRPAPTRGPSGEEPGGPELAVTGHARLTMTDGTVRESDMDWDRDGLWAQVERHDPTSDHGS